MVDSVGEPMKPRVEMKGKMVARFNPGGGTPHMKRVGMLVGNFELNHTRRPIWAWPKLFLTPKRDFFKY